ncbi:MAG: protease complex subunit PrcB family protein [Lachnospiraceae bacterium]|nr:protease complex subunit PrcB family protein [Lachnospiraceae bacterium]MDD3796734.1 protease complex subunit PrcB family protein [Lachnospiraceae bacterium]
MKKWISSSFKLFLSVLCLVILAALLLTGCGLTDGGGEPRTQLDFTVVEQNEIPEELKKVIENHKEEEIQVAYTDQGSLYVVRGYGKQSSGGYSIAVDECGEGEKKIYVATTLIGPAETDALQKDPSYPVIVLKMENRDKEVVFE